MFESADPRLDSETIRRFAGEQVRITLSDKEVRAIAALLDGLLDETQL